MAARRTTVTASTDALDTLEAEARRRDMSLSSIPAEAVDEKATALRRARRPHLGTGDSGGRSPGAAILAAEPIADDPY